MSLPNEEESIEDAKNQNDDIIHESKESRKPYTITAIFDQDNKPLKIPISIKAIWTDNLLLYVSEKVFQYLILGRKMVIYLYLMIMFATFMFITTLISKILNLQTADSLLSWTYTVLLLLIMPLLIYYWDIYVAIQLHKAMNVAMRNKSYSKSEEHYTDQRNFEWTSTNLTILNAIIRNNEKTQYSYEDLGRIAGVDRQTAKSSIKKLLDSKLIYKDSGVYYFSEVDFEIYIKKDNKIEFVNIDKFEKKKFQHLFEIMCFEAF
jgi:hypothetical protein